MKIISGDKKGNNIKTKKGLSTRPLMARVKKSLFSILTPYIDGAIFFDIFAGNGGVGIEALSRGAAYSYFVDKNNTCASIIRENLKSLGLENNAQVFNLDYKKAIEILAADGVKIDLLFIGPPYGTGFAVNTLELLAASPIIKDETILIFETRKHNELPDEVLPLKKFREERYGDTLLSFFQKENPDKE